jgi:DNA-binding beta-propeller fold protein YncE
MRVALTFCVVVVGAVLWTAGAESSGKRTYEVVHGWPQLPEGYAFGKVSGIGVDSHNHVFVFHRGEPPVMCFEGATGKLVMSWGAGLIKEAHGLAVDREDNVWLTDISLHQVLKFRHDGKLLMAVGVREEPGLDGSHFNKPTDVAVAPSGDFYVSDGYGNSRVAKFAADGKFISDFGHKGSGPGEFDTPHGIAVDDAGRIYVADRGNARVQVFDANGKYINEWGSEEIGRPWDIYPGPNGLFYIMDGGDMNPAPPDRGRVVLVDRDGRKLDEFGSFGSYDGQLYWGHALAVGMNSDVYACDVHLGMRAQKFARARKAK